MDRVLFVTNVIPAFPFDGSFRYSENTNNFFFNIRNIYAVRLSSVVTSPSALGTAKISVDPGITAGLP